MSNIKCTTTASFYDISRDDEYEFIDLIFDDTVCKDGIYLILNFRGEWLTRNNNLIRDICDIAIRTNLEKE